VRPSFYGRGFPAELVDYRSVESRARLTRCLAQGSAAQFLNLTAAYQHQSEVAYCGLTTLTVALNALDVDPAKVWKGGWR
jgi:glutathione gamma-glutamylcysteinyltransferase